MSKLLKKDGGAKPPGSAGGGGGGGDDDAPAPEKPLTAEVIAAHISLLARTGNGLSHAYTRLEIHAKGITSIDILGESYPHLRYLVRTRARARSLHKKKTALRGGCAWARVWGEGGKSGRAAAGRGRRGVRSPFLFLHDSPAHDPRARRANLKFFPVSFPAKSAHPGPAAGAGKRQKKKETEKKNAQNSFVAFPQDLSENLIKDISCLHGLEYLLSVNFRSNRIRSLPAALDKRKHLQQANFAENRLESIDIASWPLCLLLNLNQNKLTSLRLAEFLELKHLEVRANQLTTTAGLNTPKLKELYMVNPKLPKKNHPRRQPKTKRTRFSAPLLPSSPPLPPFKTPPAPKGGEPDFADRRPAGQAAPHRPAPAGQPAREPGRVFGRSEEPGDPEFAGEQDRRPERDRKTRRASQPEKPVSEREPRQRARHLPAGGRLPPPAAGEAGQGPDHRRREGGRRQRERDSRVVFPVRPPPKPPSPPSRLKSSVFPFFLFFGRPWEPPLIPPHARQFPVPRNVRPLPQLKLERLAEAHSRAEEEAAQRAAEELAARGGEDGPEGRGAGEAEEGGEEDRTER
ncbi:MAG: hypothetical protein BJ554DRAFT_5763 [Olpidium bornovanus]|uniref:Uncharacterized protein n=1 Tax=Olpidium bornovanus TaxID=278681 RepID=A0A8H7ZYV7_9FUNG|nr:MAG: hypothetical protein BJ554DRAFT_5763 [Olpidium bornovanus]